MDFRVKAKTFVVIISRELVDDEGDKDNFKLIVSPNMFMNKSQVGSVIIRNLKMGRNKMDGVELEMKIDRQYGGRAQLMASQSRITFELRQEQVSDEGFKFYNNIGLGWIDMNELLNRGQNTFHIELWDYPLHTEEEIERSALSAQMKKMEVVGSVDIVIGNVEEIRDMIVVERSRYSQQEIEEQTRKEFMGYIPLEYISYKKLKHAILPKYDSFIVPFYGKPSLRGAVTPSAVVLTMQQFTGTVHEELYFYNLLAAMWQLDMTPREFLEGSKHKVASNSGQYHSDYVRSIQASIMMITTIINNMPYASDKNARGVKSIDIDYPETQLISSAWDCEDGDQYSARLVMMLIRSKFLWRSRLVKRAAKLIDRHYRMVSGKLVCNGRPDIDTVDPNREELCHVLCKFISVEYMRKLLSADGKISPAEQAVLQWPSWMYYSDKYPPPPCVTYDFVDNVIQKENMLLSIESPSVFDYGGEFINLPPLPVLESTALSNVFEVPQDMYPGGSKFWTSKKQVIEGMIGGLKNIDTKQFGICPNFPVFIESTVVAKNVRKYQLSQFYNAVMSVAVFHPHAIRVLDVMLGRESVANVKFDPETFIDLVITSQVEKQMRYGAFFSGLTIGVSETRMIHEASVSEKVLELGAKAWMDDRPVIFPSVDDTNSVGYMMEKFQELVIRRDFIPVILYAKHAPMPNLEILEFTSFKDPESNKAFKTVLQKIRAK